MTKSNSDLKTLTRNSLFLYTAEILPRLGLLLIVPIWSSRINPAEYARWVLSLTATEILIQFGSLGFATYIVKVLYRYHDDRAQEYVGLSLKVVMVSTTLLALLMALLSPFLSRWMVDAGARPHLFAYLGIYVVFAQFNNMANLYAQYRIQNGLSLFLSLSRWIINTAVMLYCLLVRHQGFYSWVWAALFTEVIISPISVYIFREVKWRYSNRRMLSFAFRFSLPTLATQFLGWGQTRVGRYVLSFSGLGTGVGLLGAAQSFSQNYGALIRPVKLVAQRMIGHKLEADAESPHFMEFFHVFACMGLALAFLGGLFFRDIMKLFMAPSYWDARAALPALVFGLYMEEMFTMYHSLMFRYFKVWFDFSRTLLAFPTVAIATLLLVPKFGFVGAALAQSMGSLIMWLFAQRYATKITRRTFLFREKMLTTVLAFGIVQMTYLLHFSATLRMIVALAGLLPYLYFYWVRRHRLFPLLTNRLLRMTHDSGNTRWAFLLT